jgi:hypothetical protein
MGGLGNLLTAARARLLADPRARLLVAAPVLVMNVVQSTIACLSSTEFGKISDIGEKETQRNKLFPVETSNDSNYFAD